MSVNQVKPKFWLKPLKFEREYCPGKPYVQRVKARGWQWSGKQTFWVEKIENEAVSPPFDYRAYMTFSTYRRLLGSNLQYAEACALCQSHHDSEIMEWLEPVPEEVPNEKEGG